MYTPALRRKDVRQRIKTAMGWSCAMLGTKTEPRFLDQGIIDEVFGYHSNQLSQWLRKTLLVTDHRFNKDTGEAKRYLLNVAGVKYIKRLLKENRRHRRLVIAEGVRYSGELHRDEIESGNFVYKDQSNRYWNNIQYYPTQIRDPLFASYGYIHAYDIEAAAPTILTQYAALMGFNKPTPAIDDYLQHKNARRQELAHRIGVNVKTVKRVIAAVFNGAGFRTKGAIVNTILTNKLQLARLRSDPWFDRLHKEIKIMWRALGVKNSRDKAQLYFAEERRVMSAVIQYLKRQRQISNRPVRYFLEHDGWRSDTPVDLYALSRWVKNKTGYRVTFSEELIQEEIL